MPDTSPLLSDIVSDDISDGSVVNADHERDVTLDLDIRRTQPRETNMKIAATSFGFFIQGLFASSIGLEESYGVADTAVSLVFMCSPLGYLIAANLNDAIHVRLGQRGIAIVGPLCQLIQAETWAMQPPFPVLLISAVLGGVGSGLKEAAWCAWSADMGQHANRIQGIMHGAYSVGGSVAPFVVGSMISVANESWSNWYLYLGLLVCIEFITSVAAFRHEDGTKYREISLKQSESTISGASGSTLSKLSSYLAVWLCGGFLLAYVGVETSITGWIVVYMIRARHATLVVASSFSSLFNVGAVMGRLILGSLTDRLGLRQAVDLYLSFALLFQFLFIVIKIPTIDAVLVAMIGFALGPMFPSGITMLVRSLPKELHVQAVSNVALVGQIGGALMPFGQGFIAERSGIGMYPYIILIQLVVVWLIWKGVPRQPTSEAGLARSR